MATRFTEATWPKDRWPNFSFSELACRETGECVVDEVLVDCLQRLRRLVLHVTNRLSAQGRGGSEIVWLIIAKRRP